ncbi:MAG: 50S ribosomal protein L16 [Candidatus Diapherotrites archaeon]
MGLRPAHCYRGTDKPAYTRIAVTKHDRNYIGTNPSLRTRQFNMGNPLKKYDTIVDLICEQPGVQLRDNAIEATRLMANRRLAEVVGKENFFMRLRVYPFHIMRENKLAQGAGADRVSSGMKHAFGKPIGKAVRLRQSQKIFSVLCDAPQAENVKKSLLRTAPKLGILVSAKIHYDVASIGTLPKKIREEKVEVKEEKVEVEGAETAPAGDKTAVPAGKDTKTALPKETKGAATKETKGAAAKAPAKDAKKK